MGQGSERQRVENEGNGENEVDLDVAEGQNEQNQQEEGVEGRAFHKTTQPRTSDVPATVTTSPTDLTSSVDSLGSCLPPSPTSMKTSFRPFLSREQRDALKLEQSEQMGRPKKRTTPSEDAEEMKKAPPPFASTRSRTRHAQTQHAALEPLTEDDVDSKQKPRIDEKTSEVATVKGKQTISNTTTAETTTNAPQIAQSEETLITNFITNELWFRYCTLAPPMTSTSEPTFARTQVDNRGVRMPTHPAPEDWVQEVQQRLEFLLQVAGVDQRQKFIRAIETGDVMKQYVYNLLAEMVKWAVNQGPLKGRKRYDLGVLLELVGIASKGEFWKA